MPHGTQPPKAESGKKTPSDLMRRLLGGLRRREAARALPPPGQRSGCGTESLAPFLEQGRSSRPAPLE